jgi:hypothetical protein
MYIVICKIIGNLDNFPTIYPIKWYYLFISINELSLIQEMVGPFDVKHIIILLIKTVTSNVKLWTNIINSITARPIKFVVVLVIMSVSTFKPDVILYLL